MGFEIIYNRKKKKVKLSVIMSVHNGDTILKESIKSILKQSFKDLEFIIINDGSTSFTDRVIKKFLKVKKNNILYIRSRKNLGLPKMLNTGIEYSNGTYIARQDADDISFRNRMFVQINFLKKNKKIDVLGCNSLNLNTNTSIKKKPIYHLLILK
jgi:glycosyltransferase involved in cell wall biosynthesis